MKQTFPFLSLCFLLFIASCASDDPSPVEEGLDYAPLSEGSWYEYELDSVIFNDFDNSVTSKAYNLRVEIGNEITNNTGQVGHRVLRYIKPRNSTEPYQLQTVWTAFVVNNRLETYEENLHFIKFVFPPLEGRTWAGNQYIQGEGNDNPTTSTTFYDGWNYVVSSIGQSETIQSNTYDNVAHISQVDQVGGAGAVEHLVADEWYAKGVGLVKKRMEMVVENCGTPGCSDKTLPILDRSNNRKGYILNLELLDYQIQ